MKLFFAWVVGFIAATAVLTVGEFALATAGIQSWIDFGESVTVTRGSGRFSYDEDIDGVHTTPGYLLLSISLMIGVRVGMWFYTGRRDGGLSLEQQLQFRAWLYGLLILGAVGCVLYWTLGREEGLGTFVRNVAELGAAAAIFYRGRIWYLKEKAGIGGAVG